MRPIPMRIVLLNLLPLLFLSSKAFALSPACGLRHLGVKVSSESSVNRLRNGGPLLYRQLDDEDDEPNNPAMLKVMSRAPPGYKMKQALQEQQQQLRRSPPRSGVNERLVLALTLNQFLILGISSVVLAATVFTSLGAGGFSNLNDVLLWTGSGTNIFDFSITFNKLLWGVLGALPLLAFSALIENSDNRAFANINFSTITMCLTLFGRRKVPPPEFIPDSLKGIPFPTTTSFETAYQSFKLSLVTGFCEETVFRRLIPSMIALKAGSAGNLLIPYVGQALLFGLGHVQPGNRIAENGILFGLQTINGLGFGALYYLTGGDLVPCIIAHATYDFVTFFKTWKDANDQLEYAERMSAKPLPPEVNRQVEQFVRDSAGMDPRRFSILKRLFYTFDFDKNETLSLSEVRKGLAYMAVEKAGTPPRQAQIDRLFQMAKDPGNTENRLTFPEFMHLLALMNPKKAKKPRVPMLTT